MNIQDYILVNSEKVDRALNGSQQASSDRVGGVGNGAYFESGQWKRSGEVLSEKEVAVLESALLAEYDRLGGLIKKGGDKVMMGAFYDFKGRKPKIKPDVKLVFMINGREMIIDADEPAPPVIKAAQELEKIEKEEQETERKSHKLKK